MSHSHMIKRLVLFSLLLTLCQAIKSEILNEIPSYVFEHAPLVYLYSEERYNPGDIKDYVKKFKLSTQYEFENKGPQKMFLKFPENHGLSINISNLQSEYTVLKPLEQEADKTEYLYVVGDGEKLPTNTETVKINSKDCVMEMADFDYTYPHILLGDKPNSFGHIQTSPAVLIVRDHGPDSPFLDAYWFFFYGFNLGAFVMGTGPWGNHLGDWEHCITRFRKASGTPESIWLSAHGGGFAYKFDALEKYNSNMGSKGGKRPILFSGKGTHANYASVGQHAHDVPFFFSALSDFTDRGLLWDPAKNFYGYTFSDPDLTSKESPLDQDIEFKPYRQHELDTIGLSWLQYKGRWGNKKLPLSDKRQHVMPFQYTYIDGPTGPIGKRLLREDICEKLYCNNNDIYWNLLKIGSGCRIRRTIKRGQGLDAERNDMVGDNCGVLLYKVRPKWLKSIMEFVCWRGVLCYVMEFFTG